jgi:hypothetical protein
MQRIKHIIFLLLALFLSHLVYAEGSTKESIEQNQTVEDNQTKAKQYYIVEVILFRHINEQGKHDEFWHTLELSDDNSLLDKQTLSTIDNTFNDDTPALAEYDMQRKQFLPLRNGIAVLSSANYKLSDSAAHLRYSPNYKLLAHFGWTQRSLSKNRALPIKLVSDQFSDSLIPEGELELYVSRYLHIKVNLQAQQCTYAKTSPISNQASNKQGLEQALGTTSSNQCIKQVYRFKQNRKMRSKELHYIDNPIFGMLVYITPYRINASQPTQE